MNKYLCVRLLNTSQLVQQSKSFGWVDIRLSSFDLPFENIAIEKSQTLQNTKYDLKNLPRIVTIVEANNVRFAYFEANKVMEEAADFFDIFAFFTKDEILTNVGFIREINATAAEPITSSLYLDSSFPFVPGAGGIIFNFNHEFFKPVSMEQMLLISNNYEYRNDLSRSINWWRKAKSEKNLNIKLLFLWIALESLTRIEDEDILYKLMLILGFPTKKYSSQLNNILLKDLTKIENYRAIRNNIDDLLEKIRKHRNHIVHDGFRMHDLDTHIATKYNFILNNYLTRLINYFLSAINQNITTVSGVWENMPKLIENDTQYIQHTESLIEKYATSNFSQ